MTEGAGNLPQFFRLAAIRADAQVPGPGGQVPTGPGGFGSTLVPDPNAAGRQTMIQIEQLVLSASNVTEMAAELEEIQERNGRMLTGSTNPNATGGGNNGGD